MDANKINRGKDFPRILRWFGWIVLVVVTIWIHYEIKVVLPRMETATSSTL